MPSQTTASKPSLLPKVKAFFYTGTAIMAWLLTASILISLFPAADAHPAILVGGAAAVLLYRHEAGTIGFAQMFRTFDLRILLVFFILSWTGCELASQLVGWIASHFMTVEPNPNDFGSWIAIVGSVIFAPIGEELIFRLCFQGLLKRCSGKWFTILVPTVLFSIIHLYNVQGVAEVFAGTFFFALCYYCTGNLLYTILVHFLHNFLCLFQPSFLPLFGQNAYERNGFVFVSLPMLLLYLCLFIAGMVWLFRWFLPKYRENT